MSSRARLLAVLWAAGAVSVVSNVLAAEPTLVGRAVAAWPPIALLLVVEVLARSPLPAGRIRWLAMSGAAAVAAVAGLASYAHMHAVALAAGESPLVAMLFPLSVDGLAVVASVALLGADSSASNSEAVEVMDTSVAVIEDRVDPVSTPVASRSLPTPSAAKPRPVFVSGGPPVSANGSGTP